MRNTRAAPAAKSLKYNHVFNRMEDAMHFRIPDDLRIPAIVFTLEAVLLSGLALIFLVMLPD